MHIFGGLLSVATTLRSSLTLMLDWTMLPLGSSTRSAQRQSGDLLLMPKLCLGFGLEGARFDEGVPVKNLGPIRAAAFLDSHLIENLWFSVLPPSA